MNVRRLLSIVGVYVGASFFPFAASVALASRHSTVVSEQALPLRTRGTIAFIRADFLTVIAQDGHCYKVRISPETEFADVVPYSLRKLKVHDYLGSAVKGPRDSWVAVEIALVPEGMQAGRKGEYAWDRLPDTSGGKGVREAGAGSASSHLGQTETTMTNGALSHIAPTPEGLILTLSLVGSGSAQVRVLSAAPVVRFVVRDLSTVHVGAKAVIWTAGDAATLVAVGKGVVPPM